MFSPQSPAYPSPTATLPDCERYLIERLHLTEAAGMAFYKGGVKEVLRAAILNHGPSVIAGSVEGKTRTYREIFERMYKTKLESK